MDEMSGENYLDEGRLKMPNRAFAGLVLGICYFSVVFQCATATEEPNKIKQQQVRPSYAEGQVWSIQKGSYIGQDVVISYVEDHPVQKHVIHISLPGPITGLNGKVVPELQHFPFSKKGLDLSNLKYRGQIETNTMNWKEGYDEWNEPAMAGRAGIFTISVAEAMDIVFAQIPDNIETNETNIAVNKEIDREIGRVRITE